MTVAEILATDTHSDITGTEEDCWDCDAKAGDSCEPDCPFLNGE